MCSKFQLAVPVNSWLSKQWLSETVLALREGAKLNEAHPHHLGTSILIPPQGATGDFLEGLPGWDWANNKILRDVRPVPSVPETLLHPLNRTPGFSELLQTLKGHHFPKSSFKLSACEEFSQVFVFLRLVAPVTACLVTSASRWQNELTKGILIFTEKWGNGPSCLSQQLGVLFAGVGVHRCNFTVHREI